MAASAPPNAAQQRAPYRVVRSAVDVWRLLSFLLVAAIGLVLAIFGQRTLSGVAGDLVDALSDLPNVLVIPIVLVSQAVLLGLTIGAPIVLIIRGRKRIAGVGAIAIVVAVIAMVLIRYLLPAAIPSASLAVQSAATVRGPGFPSSAVMAGFAAAAVVANSELSSRWSRMVWTFLGFLVLLRFLTSNRVPLDVFFAIGLGGAVGSLLMIIFGRKIVPVSSERIATALERGGVRVQAITDLRDPVWSDWSLAVRAADDTRLLARTVGIREFRSDTLYRTYRRARLKDVGDDDSYSSPRRALAVEAMMSLMAETHGVRTPTVRALEPVGPEEYVIAIDRVDGRALDMLDDEELTAELLTDAWQQVAGLRRAGVAHRDLRLARFLVDPNGLVWLRDFGFGEPGAADSSLDGDVAELLAGTYARVGAERAVDPAKAVLGPAVLSAALVRLVPAAMTAPTRAAVKATPNALAPLIDQIRAETGADEPEFAAVERIKPRALILGIMLGVAVYVILPQLTSLPNMVEALGDANWQYVPLVVVGVIATYVGAALGLIGGTPGRLPFGQTLLLGLASSFVALMAPSGVGRVGLSVRYLQKRGLSTSVGVSASAAREVASVVVHLLLIVVFAFAAGASDSIGSEFDVLPTGETLLLVGGVLLGVIGVLVAVPKLRNLLREKIFPAIREAATAMVQVAASPMKMLSLVVGSALVPLGFITCLYFSMLAFDGDASFTAIGLVFLTVGALAAAAPTPGGVGAVEAVLLTALTGLGVPAAAALAAVFLYRLITFWLPLAPGAVVFSQLTRRGIV